MIFIIIFIALSITFATIYLAQGIHWKGIRVGEYHIHHSFFALVIMIIGIFIPIYQEITLGIGIGVYISHGLEEYIIHKNSISKSFFVFITREKN
jgi:hypothetical protein